jgi:phosphotriesterase-related protein
MSMTGAGQVMTVRGPIAPSEVGRCLPHEHIFSDLRHPYGTDKTATKGADASNVIASLDRRTAWLRDIFAFDSALVLDSVSIAVDEVRLFRHSGGRTIVDNSCMGINGDPVGLLRVSEATDVHIVASTGYYIERSLPRWVAESSIEQLVEVVVRHITEGIDGTGIRAGVMADVGTTGGVTPLEEKTLRACARAQLATGVGLGVHCDPSAQEGMRVLTLLFEEGVDPGRICLQHMDESSTAADGPDYHLQLAAQGVWLEFDTFGAEYSGPAGYRPKPHDLDRARSIKRLIDHGHLDQILVSQDVFNKFQLKTFGGEGYTSLFDHGVPRLMEVGLSETDVDVVLIDNPARYLTITHS